MIDGRVHVHVHQEEADEQFDQHEDARVTRQGALAMFLVCVCVFATQVERRLPTSSQRKS